MHVRKRHYDTDTLLHVVGVVVHVQQRHMDTNTPTSGVSKLRVAVHVRERHNDTDTSQLAPPLEGQSDGRSARAAEAQRHFHHPTDTRAPLWMEASGHARASRGTMTWTLTLPATS